MSGWVGQSFECNKSPEWKAAVSPVRAATECAIKLGRSRRFVKMEDEIMMSRKRTLVCMAFLTVACGAGFLKGRPSRDFAAAAQTAQGAPMATAKGTTDASGVLYFGKEEVTPAFQANLMLYDGVPEKKNYRVAVYHRDKGGEVEIHKKDTDVFYILEGEATFVTGGAVTGGKETAPDEVRIATMEGGVSRKIAKGDVIVIPANVTHWFKEVGKPVTYFGVKVR